MRAFIDFLMESGHVWQAVVLIGFTLALGLFIILMFRIYRPFGNGFRRGPFPKAPPCASDNLFCENEDWYHGNPYPPPFVEYDESHYDRSDLITGGGPSLDQKMPFEHMKWEASRPIVVHHKGIGRCRKRVVR